MKRFCGVEVRNEVYDLLTALRYDKELTEEQKLLQEHYRFFTYRYQQKQRTVDSYRLINGMTGQNIMDILKQYDDLSMLTIWVDEDCGDSVLQYREPETDEDYTRRVSQILQRDLGKNRIGIEFERSLYERLKKYFEIEAQDGTP